MALSNKTAGTHVTMVIRKENCDTYFVMKTPGFCDNSFQIKVSHTAWFMLTKATDEP